MTKENLEESSKLLDFQIKTKQEILADANLTLKSVNLEIREQTQIKKERQKEISELRKKKKELDSQLWDRKVQLKSLIDQSKQLNASRTTLEPIVQELEAKNIKLKEDYNTLNEEYLEAKTQLESLDNEIKSLSHQKNTLHGEVTKWKIKSDLYTNDIEGVGEAHKKSKTKYLAGTSIFGILLLLVILLIIYRITGRVSLNWLKGTIFEADKNISFYLILFTRGSLIAVLLTIVYVFLSLTKNFVSQYIRTDEKMNSIRGMLFLIEKIKVSDTALELSDEAQIELENEALQKQVEVLHEHLPQLIFQSKNAFDTVENIPITTIDKLLKKEKNTQ